MRANHVTMKLHGLGGASQRRDGSPTLGVLDELSKPLPFSLVFLCADDPPNGGFSIRSRLSLEEIPCFLVRLKLLLRSLIECGNRSILIRVSSVFFSLLKGFHTCRAHQSTTSKLLNPIDVDGAPLAARFSRRKSNSDCLVAQAIRWHCLHWHWRGHDE